MHGRYLATGGKTMPAGMVAGMSALMVLFYAWSLVLGPEPPKGAAGAGGKKKAGGAKRR
jgi:hypothetical protein